MPRAITGETGVGKELIVKALHAASPRREQAPCEAQLHGHPRGLAESELFGYERGAFTGAVTSKPGRFELAHESDTLGPELLPDEIAGVATALCETATLKRKRDNLVSASERQLIVEALEKTGQNRTRAAKLLGISRRTLQGRIRAYGL